MGDSDGIIVGKSDTDGASLGLELGVDDGSDEGRDDTLGLSLGNNEGEDETLGLSEGCFKPERLPPWPWKCQKES